MSEKGVDMAFGTESSTDFHGFSWTFQVFFVDLSLFFFIDSPVFHCFSPDFLTESEPFGPSEARFSAEVCQEPGRLRDGLGCQRHHHLPHPGGSKSYLEPVSHLVRMKNKAFDTYIHLFWMKTHDIPLMNISNNNNKHTQTGVEVVF